MKERLSDKAECRYCLLSGSFHYVLNVESHFFVRNESKFETQSLHGEQLEEVQEEAEKCSPKHDVLPGIRDKPIV